MRKLTLSATALLGCLLVPTPQASAQAFCGDRTEVIEELSLTYSEKPLAVGLTNGGGVIEILTSPKGSWTILLTHPSGVSCVMAAGENWEMLPQATTTPEEKI